jgi:mRNA deadenylase 3'-5' endonuclease subunit Ccr4
VKCEDGRWRTQQIEIGCSELATQEKLTHAYQPRKQSASSVSDWSSMICPISRTWENLRDESNAGKGKSTTRIVSYNVLAQCYTRDHYFPWATREQLDWQFRGDNLVREILAFEADVLCLQEVDQFEFFAQHLQENFMGIFKKRTGSRKDGCAIFFNRHK